MPPPSPQAGAPRRTALIVALSLALVAFGLDQASKWAILVWVMNPPEILTVTSYFDLVLVFNRGVSFGLFNENAGWQPTVFTLLAVAVTFGLLYWLWRQPRVAMALSFGLIIGGALGNALDRLVHGAVVDFLSFHWDSYYWPAFNLADSTIFVGVAVLLLHDLLSARGGGAKRSDREG